MASPPTPSPAATPTADSTPAPMAILSASPAADTERVVQAAIQEISHIATLPEVTMKIIELVEDPQSTAQDLNKVITHDPALGARILKVVNSAFYGLPGQIGSINRAIVLLGLNAVKNIAIAASLSKLFRGGKICPNFDARQLWTHSIATATATRLLAQRCGLGLPDEAFLAGLIHDIGIMVEIQARRPQFVEVIESLEQRPDAGLRAAETAILGANHEQFGSGLCKLWKFPASFQYVTGFHHHPLDLVEKNRAMACLVHIADHIAGNLNMGFAHDLSNAAEIDPRILSSMDLSQFQVNQISAELPEAIKEAQGIFQAPGA